ncbi:YeeE/YedE family protein [Reichenbachiella carrageenanivorans]|uniref:YeeE/YedE family protein n=1 Tax=Reichenbachiella carrageenanivorans TaxID=2979869 RepID=A0ABY6DBP0_9BACT|nr:YeeE/YedE family protein [Reichenbachiella carrageenanivorans]UXX81260.1 YeeE/YedE family protein [Reichenbachiella carrageenanivorans]
MELVEWIRQPWEWYVAGPMISVVMFLLLYFGKEFGVSGNLRTMCSIVGAGKVNEFFRFDWKGQVWNLVFVLGGLIGGYIAKTYLTASEAVGISEATIEQLKLLGIENPGATYLPASIFSWESLATPKYALMLVVGGALVGFGTRYAGGCTSGHAISGLSNLQWPSMVAVVGFFIGGLLMTHFILPYLLTV